MEEKAIVLKINKNFALVKINKKNECDGCKACTFKRGSTFLKVRAVNSLNAVVGDEVIVKQDKDNHLKASFLVYIFPLIFAGIGLFVGSIFKNEILMFSLCLIMLFLGYIIIAMIDKQLSKKEGFCLEIVKILPKENKNE